MGNLFPGVAVEDSCRCSLSPGNCSLDTGTCSLDTDIRSLTIRTSVRDHLLDLCRLDRPGAGVVCNLKLGVRLGVGPKSEMLEKEIARL